MGEANFYLSAATAYADHASGIFNMFLTVMFGSYAFAAAISLKHIGKPILKMSSSSLCVGGCLILFYFISFLAFDEASKNAVSLLNLITKLESGGISTEAKNILLGSQQEIFGIPLQNIGFIVGSVTSIGVFMWLSNVTRQQK